MNKKKKIVVIILLALILLVLGFLILVLIKNMTCYSEEKIVKKLTTMGEEIYGNYYYPSISRGKNNEEVKEFLQKYEEIGLKFNLTELEKYSEDFKNNISKFKNNKKQCNKDDTMVIIYPKSPYNKTDYAIEVKLECGFKKSK